MTPIGFHVVVTEQDSPADRDALLQQLLQHNAEHAPPTTTQPLGIFLKNDAEQTVGGLWGISRYDWLFIELLFVPAELRGRGAGSSLLRQAEDIARARNCTGVWLDTFAFQALPFYQKLGYTIFGELKDHPRGISQYWLQKRFSTSLPTTPAASSAPETAP